MQNAIALSNYLNFPGIPAKFRENFSEKKSNLPEAQIFLNFREIINKMFEIVRKTVKFELGEVPRNANLVDIEKC